MAKRIKKKDDIYTILTFEQADTHLVKMGQLQRELEEKEAAAEKKINEAKAELARESKAIQGKIQKHCRSLETFCVQHRQDFGSMKSRKLMFGTVGWRKSTSITISKKTTLQKILEVFQAAADQYLHVKKTPDKDALAKLTDAQLKQVDARRVIKDGFFAEPDLTESVNYGNPHT